MRIIGLDVGTKTIGVAVSDALGWTANGVETIRYSGSYMPAIKRVGDIIDEYEAKECVVGFPLNMDGTTGKQGEFVIHFTEKLKETIDIPCHLWDERLSSWEAERVLISADVNRKKRKQVIDKIAAIVILKSFLESRENAR